MGKGEYRVTTTRMPSISPVASRGGKMPIRLIVCVDGTRYEPGAHINQTTIYRIYASIKSGNCIDRDTGIEYKQIPRYITGIGAADDVFSKDKLQAAWPGQGYHQQIQNVYEACCELTGEHDEVVLFGFATGAYTVRAVAGLLHHFGALVPAGQPFSKAFKQALKESDRLHVRPGLSLHRSSTASSTSSAGTVGRRAPPRIRFLGVFDTVKAIQDDKAFDIGANASIKHLRHALALHENKKVLTPEYIHPEESYGTEIQSSGRSELQAWFIGHHQDMGGCSTRLGLSLYPLQWMLFEANACGVWLDFEGSGSHGYYGNCLSLVFPRKDDSRKAMTASFTAANGAVVTMQDLREMHELPSHKGNYAVKLSAQRGSLGTLRATRTRSVFVNGHLRGYCDYAPQGTIIHPSVYLLLDEHINVALDTKEARLQGRLEDWRGRMLGSTKGVANFGFWGEAGVDDEADLGALRVLVCGNTGVGKSTLINKTFGVDVTQASDRARGIHDVKQEIKFEGRPDLIIHDSGGFEAGAEEEFRAIEEFLAAKSETLDVQDRIHVIWFCIEINNARTMQTATERLFQAVSKYAKEVPIVVVATKKDDLLDLEFSKRRKELKKLKQPFDEDDCDQYAEEQLNFRLEQIQQELESLPGGRLDAIVAVSQDDDESISSLSKTTSQCFDTDKVRFMYIRAQVARIDLKVDLAMCEVMRRYRLLVRTATGISFTVTGPTAFRKAAANKACKAILNCFGLPTVSADSALAALRQNVWNHGGVDFSVALAECINTIGFVGTGFAGGIPAWLVTGAISIPLVVPSTCRLFLNMSCDLILTLVRSFKEVTFRASGQPTERDVQAAARIYRIRGYSQYVHRDINKLVRKRKVKTCYEFDNIERTIEAFTANYKDKLIDGINLPLDNKGLPALGSTSDDDGDGDDDDLTLTNSGTSFMKQLRESNLKAIDLNTKGAIPLVSAAEQLEPVELATVGVERIELPDNERLPELEGSAPIVRSFRN